MNAFKAVLTLLAALTVVFLYIGSDSTPSLRILDSTTGYSRVDQFLNLESARNQFDRLIDLIPDYKNVSDRVGDAESWSFDPDLFMSALAHAEDKCAEITKTFAFFDRPLSQEEHDYPLAYGLLVHDAYVQLMFLLSSVYQPQNQFCIAVDAYSSDQFQEQMRVLSGCFPNIYIMLTPKVEWCRHSVLEGVFGCVQYLTSLKSDWKYYQYLSGVDLPIKTNLEMVRIFKKLNGSFSAGIYDLEPHRIISQPPLPLWKSSLSATFSRESANFLVFNKKVLELYHYLKTAGCPDESFWATIAGNPEHIPMPGGFNATQWKQKLTGEWDALYGSNETTPLSQNGNSGLFEPENYYIARYQVWRNSQNRTCLGMYTMESCVYGVKDLPALIQRPELIAHKLYLSFQPAAFFWLYEHVRRRALLGDREFSVDAYAELPGPQLMAGTPFEQVKFKVPHGYEYY